MKKLLLASIACLSLAIGVSTKSISTDTLYATEETTSSEVVETSSEEIATSSEETSIKEWVMDKWENLFLPVIIGIGVPNIILFIVNFILNNARRRKMTQLLAKNEENADSSAKFLATQAVVFEELHKNNELSLETKRLLEQKMNELELLIAENSKNVKSIEKIKPILSLLSGMIVKIGQCNDDVVKKGFVADIEKLDKLVKELATNEQDKK